MRRVLAVVWIWMLLFEITVHAKGEEPEQLYAQSAVLMDAGVAKKQLYILTGGGKNLVLNYKDQLVTGIEK